jgi:hypothetical protein
MGKIVNVPPVHEGDLTVFALFDSWTRVNIKQDTICNEPAHP